MNVVVVCEKEGTLPMQSLLRNLGSMVLMKVLVLSSLSGKCELREDCKQPIQWSLMEMGKRFIELLSTR